MDKRKLMRGKRILIVDDEEDVLNTLTDLLETCKVDRASSFEEGKRLLESEIYDLAILDIMGVKGFELLKVAGKQEIPALMLTAHALSEENLKYSAESGASYFAPKDELSNIAAFVEDVIDAKEKNKNVWAKWFERLGGYYDRKFVGPNWREKEKKFWERKLAE